MGGITAQPPHLVLPLEAQGVDDEGEFVNSAYDPISRTRDTSSEQFLIAIRDREWGRTFAQSTFRTRVPPWSRA